MLRVNRSQGNQYTTLPSGHCIVSRLVVQWSLWTTYPLPLREGATWPRDGRSSGHRRRARRGLIALARFVFAYV
jgi:hypothetical protein